MEEKSIETVELKSSATANLNDVSVSTDAILPKSNAGTDANSEKSVEKTIAEVDARIKEKEQSCKEGAAKDVTTVDTSGHEFGGKNDKNADAGKKEPSERVKEGQKWNNRDRSAKPKSDLEDYRKNVISDLTSQPESSDPVAIRKQVNLIPLRS